MAVTAGEQFFGREDVLGRLLGALGEVEAGGFGIGVAGEPGVGKSALLRRLAEGAESARFTVLSAQGSQSETHLPYASLHQLLGPLLSQAHGLPTQQEQSLLACFGMVEAVDVNPFFTALAVLELLVEASSERPLLVALDDLHWMDRPTTDALAFVARRIADERVVLLCTSRAQSPLLGDDQVVRWIELDGLPTGAAEALLRSRAPDLAPGVRRRVIAHAGGNPLALVEFAAALQSGTDPWTELDTDLPMTTRLERAFAARADELEPTGRTVLDVAALDDGDDLDEVLTAAGLVSGRAVDRTAALAALDLGLLTISGPTYAFRHPLMRSALRHAMSQERRERGHAALASALAAHPERAVWHRANSIPGREESVAAELERSAAEARRRGAFATALTRLERAPALSPDPRDQAARLLGVAELGYELGRFARVEEIKAQVTRLTMRPRDRARLTWLEGAFHDGAASEPADVRRLVDLARRATGQDDTDLAMQLLFGAARRVWWRDPGEAVREEIIGAARAVPLPAGDPRLLAVLGLAEAPELSGPIIDQLNGWPADGGGRADLAVLLGIAAFCAGDFVRAESYLSTAIRELRAEGRLSLLAEALAIRAWAEINLGVFDTARSADEGVRLADETGQQVWAGTARLAVALVDAIGGSWSARHPLLAQAESTALQLPNASSSLLAGAQLVRGVGELGADRPEQAYSELRRVFVPTDPAHQRVQQLWTVSYLAEAAVRSGRRVEAAAQVDAVERLANGTAAVGTAIALEYSRAVLAEDAAAEDLFRTAVTGAAHPFPWHQARAQLAHGSWLRRQRRVTESREPLRAARSAFDALGAKAWAVRADQELRATGERGWQPTTTDRAQLSAQEAQIAELAAQGMSNREIGQRLFLSHRTVGSHLYRIFPKLGITSRQQLAGALGGDVLHAAQSSD
ncbi:helix-turn-helix transcriptional regulator [Pseudonocardia sp. CA-107938]|uniref:helix-turn-helix transcriptional regulator n=1 Tax=Pseudonocardia sp. CA-107938 TaxID=3240021 RepID=UPI003D89DBCE